VKIKIILLLAMALLAAGCTQVEDDVLGSDPSTEPVVVRISVQHADGTEFFSDRYEVAPREFTLWEVMQQHMDDIGYQKESFGIFITELRGVPSQPNEYWSLWIDDAYAEKGVTDILVDRDMRVLWKIESFK
jgi:hypothetical protein